MRKLLLNNIEEETNLKKIYNNIQENQSDMTEDTRNQFYYLSKTTNPQLWLYGFLTLHKGHITRAWLYRRNFTYKDIQKSKGKCDICRTDETQDHIIEHCKRTKPLREHIKTQHEIQNFSQLTQDKEINQKILACQKTMFPYTIHLNKGNAAT